MSEEQTTEEATTEDTSIEGTADETTEETTEESENVEETEESGEESEGEENKEESGEEDSKETEEPETVNIKVYGKEIPVTHDQLIRLAQKGMASDQSWKDAETKRQELLSVINEMKDPQKIFPLLEKMGHNTRKLTEDHILQQYERETMSAEEKALYEREQRVAAQEKAQAANKNKQNQEILAVKEQEALEHYDKEFSEAITEVEIPKTEESIAKMAHYMESSLLNGVEISAKQAALLVRDDMSRHYSELAEKATPEQLIKLFGDKLPKKFKNYDLSKITSPEDKNKVNAKVKPKTPRDKRGHKRTYEQLKEIWDKDFGGDPWDEPST